MLNTKIRSHLTQLARVAAASLVLALGFTHTAFAYQATHLLAPVTMTAGTNPGNLAMFQYLPTTYTGTLTNRPLVVVLHGCTQTAEQFATESGWKELAEKKGLYLVVAQTNTTNNPNSCFRWFDSTQNVRNLGEAASIAAMVSQFQTMPGHAGLVDINNIYVAGFSAGGAMAAVMMATYPNVFSGGSINSGVPYGCATNLATGLTCMTAGPLIPKTPAQWGAAAKAAYTGLGARKQKVALFHGDYRDITVTSPRMTELMQQWTSFDGLSQLPTTMTPVKSFPGKQYSTVVVVGGGGKVQTVSVEGLTNGMGHGVAVNPGPASPTPNGIDQCGTAGTYAFNKGMCAAYYSCAVWGF